MTTRRIGAVLVICILGTLLALLAVPRLRHVGSRPTLGRTWTVEKNGSSVSARRSAREGCCENVAKPDVYPSKQAGFVARMGTGYAGVELTHGNGNIRSREAIDNAISRVTGAVWSRVSVRFAALDMLSGVELDEADRERLLAYLVNRDRVKHLSNNDMYTLVNQLLAVFHTQTPLDPRFLEVSATVIANADEDEVIRDYTLQALSRGYFNAGETEAKGIRQILLENIERTDSSLAGNALLSLNRLRRRHALSIGEVDRLKAAVSRYIYLPVGERTRIPAMQIAAEMGLVESLPALAVVASDESASSCERSSATAALRLLERQEYSTSLGP